jgi:hypothetical protein
MKSLFARAALLIWLLLPLGGWSQVSLSIEIAPPPLPVYAQPPVPGEGYIWVPGYWAWERSDRDYYWVPGTWVLAPNYGDLWTPGYWAFEGQGYFWHIGYWGSRVGFYGGLNYGYGYTGSGYQGGRWDHDRFQYNRAVSNVGAVVANNSYSARVVNGARNSHVSFNGGKAGSTARPTVAQRQFQTAEHAGPSAEQLQHEHAALTTPTQRLSSPHSAPLVGATPRPSAFDMPGVEPVLGATSGRRAAGPIARPAQPKEHAAAPPRAAQARPARGPVRRPEQETPEPRREPSPRDEPGRGR